MPLHQISAPKGHLMQKSRTNLLVLTGVSVKRAPLTLQLVLKEQDIHIAEREDLCSSRVFSGCSASTSFLTSSTPTLWSVDIRSATTELLTPPSVVTLRPSTALESPRFATNSTPFDIAAVRQHDPTEAICGCANHDLLTIRKNSSSIASTRVEGSTLDVTEKVVGNETRSFRAAMAVVNADIGGGGGGVNLTLIFKQRISLNHRHGIVPSGVALQVHIPLKNIIVFAIEAVFQRLKTPIPHLSRPRRHHFR
nr:hypothetical protein BHM03_00011799 [Ipomoea batatas]